MRPTFYAKCRRSGITVGNFLSPNFGIRASLRILAWYLLLLFNVNRLSGLFCCTPSEYFQWTQISCLKLNVRHWTPLQENVA